MGFAVEDAEREPATASKNQTTQDWPRVRFLTLMVGWVTECVCHDDALLSCQVVAYATISRKKTPLRQRSALSPPSFLAALSSKAIPSSPSSSLA